MLPNAAMTLQHRYRTRALRVRERRVLSGGDAGVFLRAMPARPVSLVPFSPGL